MKLWWATAVLACLVAAPSVQASQPAPARVPRVVLNDAAV